MNINTVIVSGNCVKRPEMRATNSGKDVATWTIGVHEGKDKPSSFIDIEAWDKTAQIAHGALDKGCLCVVEGRIKQDRWEKDGQKRSKLKVVAFRIYPVDRRERSTKEQTAAPDDLIDDTLPF